MSDGEPTAEDLPTWVPCPVNLDAYHADVRRVLRRRMLRWMRARQIAAQGRGRGELEQPGTASV